MIIIRNKKKCDNQRLSSKGCDSLLPLNSLLMRKILPRERR
jgi:hypothetical protein